MSVEIYTWLSLVLYYKIKTLWNSMTVRWMILLAIKLGTRNKIRLNRSHLEQICICNLLCIRMPNLKIIKKIFPLRSVVSNVGPEIQVSAKHRVFWQLIGEDLFQKNSFRENLYLRYVIRKMQQILKKRIPIIRLAERNRTKELRNFYVVTYKF